MKRFLLPVLSLLFLLALCALEAPAQVCDPTRELFPADAITVSGATSKISSKNFQIAASVGNSFIGSTRNPNVQTGSKSMELGFWSFMLTEPNTPIVHASDGDFEDRVEIRWEPLNDPVGPPIEEQRLYRDNQFLATFSPSVTAYLDFNVLPGRTYKYDVVTTNRFGSSITGTDVGFVNPNGIITGTIETRSFVPVKDVEVVLAPTIAYSVRFDGISDRIVLTDSAINNLTEGTLEFWVNPSKLTQSTILSKRRIIAEEGHPLNYYSIVSLGSYPDASGNSVDGTPGKVYFAARSGAPVIASKRNLPADVWTHVAISFSSNGARFYVNGLLDNDVDGDFSIPDDHSPRDPRPVRTYAGYWEGTGNYFQGHLDELRFWSSIRTDEEIFSNLNRTIAADDPNLFLYWKFDEGKGTRSYDLSGNFNHGLFCNPLQFVKTNVAPVYTSGLTNERGSYIIKGVNYGVGTTFSAKPRKLSIIGRALELDGVDDEVESPRSVGDSSTVTGTIEAWVYTRSVSGSQPIVALRNNRAGVSSGIFSIENGYLSFQAANNTMAIDATPIDTGNWFHVAVVYTDSMSTFYVNGERGETAYGDFSIDRQSAGTRTTVGSFQTSHFYGRIDEVRVWNVGRTQQQIQARMNSTLKNEFDGLEAYWKFNEGGGEITADESPNLYVADVHADSTVWTKSIPINETVAHTFIPESRDITLAPSNTVVDKVDFTDNSLIPVVGFVKYVGTNCFADSVEVLVDGLSTAPQTYTGTDGKFLVELEPGTSHKLTFRKKTHQFIPAFYEVKNIEQPLFIKRPILDSETNTITGDVAGGNCKLPIGASEVHIQSVNGCIDARFTTDENGHYQIPNLPPLVYNINVTHPDPTIAFDAEQVSLAEGDASKDFIYYSPLRAAIEFVTDDNCLNEKMLVQKKVYTAKIQIFEQYGDARCPVDSGSVMIADHLTGRLKEKKFVAGVLRDTIYAQNVNIIPPYTLRYEVIATDAVGREADASMDLVVLGTVPRGRTYATTSPLMPIMILRDPPGDASSSFFMKESSYTLAASNSSALAFGLDRTIELKWGPKVTTCVGLGACTEIEHEVTNSVSVGAGFTKTFDETHDYLSTITFSSQYSTSASEYFIGQNGDVYIGYASLIKYGIGDDLFFDTTNCQLATKTVIVINGDSVEAMYFYSEQQLKTVELPRLDSLSTNPSIDSVKREYFSRQSEAWRRWIALNERQKDEAKFRENITWDGGAIIDNSVQSTSEGTDTWSVTWDIHEDVAIALGFAVNKVGFQTNLGAHFGQTSVNGGSKTINSSRTYGYHLEDDDAGDLHGVAIHEASDGSPVFKLIGGETSCPHEPGTLAREGPQLSIVPNTLINVPPDEDAAFSLILANNSPTNEARDYIIFIDWSSNPNGAFLSLNGADLGGGIPVTLPPGVQVPVTLLVTRGPEKYDYDDMRIYMVSACELASSAAGSPVSSQFSDTLSFSVHFEVPCSEVRMAGPTNNWLVTGGDMDSVYVTLFGFDRDNPDFKELRFQYRVVPDELSRSNGLTLDPQLFQPIGTVLDAETKARMFKPQDNPWINAKIIPRDSLPEDENFITFPWVITSDLVADGLYDIRAISSCHAQTINGSTALVRGRIDRTPPVLLGSTEPVDGVLGPDDQIIARFDEDIDCGALHPLFNVHLTNTSTGLEIDRNVTCNGNIVVVTPNIANKFLENQVLRLSFTDDGSAPAYGVRDLYGNRITRELKYEFYVDKNSMRWNNPTFQGTFAERTAGNEAPISFTRLISNSGTFTQTYTMSGLPTWLSVSPVSATIPAGFTQEVTFTVSPQLSGGVYLDTVYAQTEGGNEDLRIDFRILCPAPPWTVNATEYLYSMNIVARLLIDSVESHDEYTTVGVFVGNEVRGIGKVQYVSGVNQYLVFLTIYSNVVNGEPLSIRVWDAGTCRELGRVHEQYNFAANSVYGTITRPSTLTATTEVSGQTLLARGWSWFSLNLRSSDMSVNAILGTITQADGNIVKGQTKFSQAVPGFGWVGSLAALDNRSMYQIKLATPDTIETVGYEITGDTIPIVPGWNWVSYQPLAGMNLNTALASYPAVNGDLIKSQFAFAVYFAPVGWLGDLTFMTPKLGYLLKAGVAGNLVFPTPGSGFGAGTVQRQEGPNSPKPISNPDWAVDVAQFQYSMQVIGEIPGEDADTSSVVAAFVNGECRGVARVHYIEALRKSLFFLQIYGTSIDAEEIAFRFHDARQQLFFNANESAMFAADSVIGAVDAPFTISASLTSVDGSGLPKEFALGQNYPNPFNPVTNIRYALPRESYVEIGVYDVVGQKVRTLVIGTQSAGERTVAWDGTDDRGVALGSGVYFCKMTAGDFLQSRKLLLMK